MIAATARVKSTETVQLAGVKRALSQLACVKSGHKRGPHTLPVTKLQQKVCYPVSKIQGQPSCLVSKVQRLFSCPLSRVP